MTPSFLITPTGQSRMSRRGIKEMAIFGLRKAFVDPAPKPKPAAGRMERFFGSDAAAMDFWVPE